MTDNEAKTPIEIATKAMMSQIQVDSTIPPMATFHPGNVARAAFKSISREGLEEALNNSGKTFAGTGEELGTEEIAILVPDAIDAILTYLLQERSPNDSP